MKVYCTYGHHCSNILLGGGGGLRTTGIYTLCIYSSSIYKKVGNSFGKLWYAAVVEYVAALHCYKWFADLFPL
jgi:CRISPR/Cas system CSM-associated protein Csm5 (group 7 of RAMP superfamily)